MRHEPARIREDQSVREQMVRALLERGPARLVTVPCVNKMARTAWALLAREEDYRDGETLIPSGAVAA